MQCSSELEGAELPESLQLAAFRIVQESLTNVLKHAGPAAQALVAVDVAGGGAARRLVVRVCDDGGRAASLRNKDAVDDAPPGAGHGLIGIAERAALFGGQAHTGPRPGGGFEVRAELPW